jgi:uncharacterized LabA/DUF88 family protein
MEKIGVFVDVQNIYNTTRHTYNKQFNYRELWRLLCQKADIEIAFAYATDRGIDSQKKFQAALRHIGFEVKLKPFIQRADGSAKGDWDVGITIDALFNAPSLERVVLLSGDGDFDLLVGTIRQRYEIPVDVYGVPTLSADSLKRAATNFYAIEGPLLM